MPLKLLFIPIDYFSNTSGMRSLLLPMDINQFRLGHVYTLITSLFINGSLKDLFWSLVIIFVFLDNIQLVLKVKYYLLYLVTSGIISNYVLLSILINEKR